MSRLSLLLKGSALQSLEAIIAIVVGFITLPMMLNHLGSESYGIWVLIGGFTGLLYIFDLGFASSVTRGVAGSIATKNHHQTNTIVNSALLIYSALAVAIGLIVIAIAIFYDFKSQHVISKSEFTFIILAVGFSIAIEFPFKAFAGLITAHLRYDLVALYRIIIKILNTGLLIYLLVNDYGLVEIALLQLFTSVISNFSFLWMTKHVYKEICISTSLVSIQCMRELFHYSSWAFVIDINRLLKERIDLFFIGGFISLSAVSIYYIPVRLVEYTLLLLYKGLNISLPILAGDYSKGDDKAFWENLLLMNRVYIYVGLLTLVFFITWGESIIYYWMGPDFASAQAYMILIILLLGRLAALCSNGFGNALYARAQHKVLAWFNIWETIVTSIMLLILLAWLDLGPMAAACSIAVPLIGSRIFILPYVAIKYMKMNESVKLLFLSYRPILIMSLVLTFQYLFPLDKNITWQHAINSIVFLCVLAIYIYIELLPRERALFSRFLSPKSKA